MLAKIPSNLSTAVQADIAALRPLSVAKMGLEFKRRFWEEDEGIFGGITNTNMDLNTIWYPSYGYLGERGVLIGYYNFFDTADRYGVMTPKDREKRALEQGRKIHGDAYVSEFLSSFSQHWSRERYSGGGWVEWPDRSQPGRRRDVPTPARAAGQALPGGRPHEPRDVVAARGVRVGPGGRHPTAPAGPRGVTEPARGPAWQGAVRPLLEGALVGAGLALRGVALLTVLTAPPAFPSLVVAVPSPVAVAPTATPFVRSDVTLALGPDGIDGLAPLGLDAEHALAHFETAFGLPNEDVSFPCPGHVGGVRSVRWADLTALFADSTFVGYLDGLHYPNDGPLLELTTTEGVGIGSTRRELVAAYGDRVQIGPPTDDVQGDVEEFMIDDGRLSGLIEGKGETGVVITVRAGVACFPEPP